MQNFKITTKNNTKNNTKNIIGNINKNSIKNDLSNELKEISEILKENQELSTEKAYEEGRLMSRVIRLENNDENKKKRNERNLTVNTNSLSDIAKENVVVGYYDLKS